MLLCFDLLSVCEGQLSKIVVDFSQPPCVWRLVSVRHAPGQLVLRRLRLMEEAWKLSMDDAGNPVHHETCPPESSLACSSIAIVSFTYPMRCSSDT